ncbi:MAG: hypothetical protein KGL39_05540 [Patescibacteria group bacterium]|nr:hypothetical protein [Patescibacteria group bacterium]
MTDPLNALTVAFVFAFLIERFVEKFVKVALVKSFPKVPGAVACYVALGLGVIVAYGFRVDVFSFIGIPAVSGTWGEVATGFLIGGGSNWLNDLNALTHGRLPSPTS